MKSKLLKKIKTKNNNKILISKNFKLIQISDKNQIKKLKKTLKNKAQCFKDKV